VVRSDDVFYYGVACNSGNGVWVAQALHFSDAVVFALMPAHHREHLPAMHQQKKREAFTSRF
jgi:hypothetical protein